VWDPGVAAGFEHGQAQRDRDLAAIRIGDMDHLTPPCRQVPHRAGEQYEPDTARKSSQDGVAYAFQESPLHGVRGMHDRQPLLDPVFLLAQLGHLPPGLGKAQQRQDGYEQGDAKERCDDPGVPRLETKPEVQPHAAVRPGNGQEHRLFDAEVWADLPVEQDQACV
jgi:hypothetical protein